MLKIGAFTFGGGYAMINLLDYEFVEKKRWLEREEFLDLVTVAESTPGPIAINCSTYIGYKREGIIGSLIGTLGIVLPSFVTIFIISLIFDRFLESSIIAAAFRGIRVCVVFLILSAGAKMLKKMKKTPLSIAIFAVTFTVMTVFSLLSVKFSSIFYVLISGSIGVIVYSIGYVRGKRDGGEAK